VLALVLASAFALVAWVARAGGAGAGQRWRTLNAAREEALQKIESRTNRNEGRMPTPTTIRLFGTVSDSIVDGPGMRFSVFVQGCTHRCPGCHNPESWPADTGEETSIDQLVARICANKLTTGVTLSGGDPFEQPAASAELARQVKAAGLNVWVYTGYVYEDLLRMAGEAASVGEAPEASELAAGETPEADERAQAIRHLLEYADVLVDGPFIQAKRSLDLKYCGSSNQRLIDMNKTRAAGHVVLWQTFDNFPTKPPSW
jgi:anaerobic ribonucleoside-triphosphate reductase activating protein